MGIKAGAALSLEFRIVGANFSILAGFFFSLEAFTDCYYQVRGVYRLLLSGYFTCIAHTDRSGFKFVYSSVLSIRANLHA